MITRLSPIPAPWWRWTARLRAWWTMAVMRTGSPCRWLRGVITGLTSKDLNGQGTLEDPSLLGIYDAEGNLIDGIGGNDDGGEGYNSYLEFTAPETGAYYIAPAPMPRTPAPTCCRWKSPSMTTRPRPPPAPS